MPSLSIVPGPGDGGLLDLKDRRLLPDPGQPWRSAATTPAVLGL